MTGWPASAARRAPGVQVYRLREGEDFGSFYRRRGEEDEPDRRELIGRLDLSRIFEFDPVRSSALRGLVMEPGQRVQGLLTFRPSKNVQPGQLQRFTVVQEQAGSVVGGSTYELRLNRARGLHPVSHIRVVVEHLQVGNARAHPRLVATLSINGEPSRQYSRFLGRRWRDVEPVPGLCVFDGYVAESDRASFTITEFDEDRSADETAHAWYRREFDCPPEMWVGRFGSDENPDPETSGDLRISYRVESMPLT